MKRAPCSAQAASACPAIEVGRHVAVRRVDDGGAAVQDVVAAEQQAVFFQQAQVVGGVAWVWMARRVWVLISVWRLSSQRQKLLIL